LFESWTSFFFQNPPPPFYPVMEQPGARFFVSRICWLRPHIGTFSFLCNRIECFISFPSLPQKHLFSPLDQSNSHSFASPFRQLTTMIQPAGVFPLVFVHASSYPLLLTESFLFRVHLFSSSVVVPPPLLTSKSFITVARDTSVPRTASLVIFSPPPSVGNRIVFFLMSWMSLSSTC